MIANVTGDPRMTLDLQRKKDGAQSASKSARESADLVRNADHDPDYVTFRESFLTMRHQEILDRLQSMTPATMQDHAQTWKQLADSAMFNSMGLGGKVHQTLASGALAGSAADAIQEATKRFTDELADMHNVTQSVASRVESATDAAAVVKGAVPPVPAAAHTGPIPGAPLPGAVIGNVASASEAEQQAQRAMMNYYMPVYPVVGQQVPTYTPPKGPAGGGLAPGTAGPGVGPAGGPGGSAAAQPNSGQHGTAPGDKPGAPRDQSGAGGNPDQQGQHPGGPGSGAGDGTTPAAAGTGTGGLPGAGSTHGADAVTPAGWSPGSGGSGAAGFGGPDGGFGGGGSGGLPGSGDAKGGPGRSLPGPGRSGAGTSGTESVRPAAAAAGASGFPGMGMPGAKGKEKDKEHKGKPELLVNERNARDLIGDPVKAAPPVFGKNPEADTQSPESEQERRRR
ncbi:MAG: hypothetical protein J2P18_08725 [Nocardia sp.]|nr:hypothetical protein [Nocardia sp.]